MADESEAPSATVDFAPRLRAWADTFPSYSECASALGVGQEKLSRWMSGFGGPSLATLIKMAAAGLNAHWALTGSGPMIWTDELNAAGALADENRTLRPQLADIARDARNLSTKLDALLPSEERAAQE